MKAKRIFALALMMLGLLRAADTAYAFYNPCSGRWLSRDPIGELGFKAAISDEVESAEAFEIEGEKPPYLFVGNSPAIYYDLLGLWPSMRHWLAYRHGPLVHQNAIHRQITGISGHERDWLVTAVEFVDLDQETERSFVHAMSAPKEAAATAKKRANFWVQTHLLEAQKLLCKACEDSGMGGVYRDMALWEFGLALHTIQDATSPSHVSFQTWFGLKPWHLSKARAHLKRESFDPGNGSRLDAATAWLWTFFVCTKDSPPLPKDFFWNLGHDEPSVDE